MIRPYLFKLIRSPLFYFGYLAALLASLYIMCGGRGGHGWEIFSDLSSLIGFEFYRKMFVIFAVLPFSSNFSDEWNSKAVINCITRKKAGNYAFSNAAVCYLSAFAVIFAGFMTGVLIRMPFEPLYDGHNPIPPYGVLCENGGALLAVILIVFVYASSCAMWAVMGLAATAFFPSRYVAVCAPFVFSYIVERFTRYLPGEFQLAPLSQSASGWEPLPAFLKSVLILLAISAVCCVIFVIKVKRRVENELS